MDLFDFNNHNHEEQAKPLAERMRANSLDEFIGQKHIVAEGSLLRRAIATDRLGSCIFWGPPGCGKTTLANVVANATRAEFVNFSAVTSGIKEIKEILSGQDSFLYDLWMNLTPCEIDSIYQIWSNYKERGKISLVDFDFLQNKMRNIMINTKTIEDLCWEKLLTLLIGLPAVDGDFCTYNLLYTKEIDTTSICEEVERLIDILQGKKPVHVLLRYTRTNFGCNIL